MSKPTKIVGSAEVANADAPLVAIVGRPNVGKSTLFNRFVGGRPALVHDTPGLTRDRRYGDMDYFGAEMRVVDTGGLDPEAAKEVIGAGIHRQALRAIDEAAALMLVVDGRAGLSAIDQSLAKQLRATGKPVFLVVNKIDHAVRDDLVHEFHELGLGAAWPVSAAHGRGIDALLEAVSERVGAKRPEVVSGDGRDGENDDHDHDDDDVDDDDVDDADDDVDGNDQGGVEVHGAVNVNVNVDDDVNDHVGAPVDVDHDVDGAVDLDATVADDVAVVDPSASASAPKPWHARRADDTRGPLRVAFLGRPNAGKSSLTNRLLGEERSLVHDVAGTTTDPVDTPFSIGGRDYILVDTAGIRRKARTDGDVEKIAVSMALGQLDRADVAVLVIDAALGPAEQDARIAGYIEDAGRGLVVALNKADLVRGDAARAQLKEQTTDIFHFLTWAPSTLISAARGDGVDRLLDTVDTVAREHARRIPTAQLNRFFAEVIEEMPPPLHHGRAVKIHYLTQGGVRPPTFILWANTPDGLAPSYKRFLSNRLRERYGFRGTPIRIIVKARKDRHD